MTLSPQWLTLGAILIFIFDDPNFRLALACLFSFPSDWACFDSILLAQKMTQALFWLGLRPSGTLRLGLFQACLINTGSD
jgi:hypothetical protein